MNIGSLFSFLGSAGGTVPQMSVSALASELRNGEVQLVDVRTPAEFRESRVETAVNIPLSELRGRASELDKSKPVHLICRSGARSMRAGGMLAAQGFEAFNIQGGMLAWLSEGHPAEH